MVWLVLARRDPREGNLPSRGVKRLEPGCPLPWRHSRYPAQKGFGSEGTDKAIGSVMGTPGNPPGRNGSDIDLDLGFGKFVSSKSRSRLLNRDGTFNVRRRALGGSAERPRAGDAES